MKTRRENIESFGCDLARDSTRVEPIRVPLSVSAWLPTSTKERTAIWRIRSAVVLVQEAGYTAQDHERGWSMLMVLMGREAPFDLPKPVAAPQEQAIALLDQWDGPAFSRARAALDHQFPDQSRYVFSGLTAQSGAGAVGSVRTFLDRIEALRSGGDPQRAAAREQDAQAVALLEQRRIVGAAIETRMRELIGVATSLAPVPEQDPPAPDASQRHKAAQQFHAWLTDWREQARSLITRRDYQIRLGLTEPRSAAAEGDDEDDAGDPSPGGGATPPPAPV